MMETRISKCQEATGKSREECAKEVKARMKKAGSENTNTEDMDDVEDEEVETTEVCKEKYDMLEEFYEKNKDTIEDMKEKADKYEEMKEDMVKMKAGFEKHTDYINKLKEIEAKKIENKVEKKIQKLAKSHSGLSVDMLREKIGDNSGKEALKVIQDFEDILGAVVKPEEPEPDDLSKDLDELDEEFTTDLQKQQEELFAKLKHS
jgi:DNA repair ATPase RecN